MKHLDVLQFLRKHDLFVGFTDEQIGRILPFIERKLFEKGEWILKEGEEHREICFFLSGKAESLIYDDHGYHPVEEFEAGDWTDSTAFLESQKRITSVRALEPTEVFIISMEEVRPILEEMGLYSQFIANFSREVCSLLRGYYEKLLHTLKEKTRMLRWHDQISKVIVHLFVLVGVYIYIYNVFNVYLKGIIPSEALSPFVIFGIAVSAAIVIKGSGYSLRFYGVTCKNWLKHSIEAILWSLPVLGVLVVVKWVLIQKVSIFEHSPLFEIELKKLWKEGDKAFGGVTLAALYFILVPVQEFLTRGFLQTVFRTFFRGSSRVILAILVSNLLFEIFHTIKGVAFAFAAFSLGLFLGTLYERQRSIVGVSVAHALIAAWALGFLGFSQILSY